MHITMVTIAVHQITKRSMSPKEPNAMEVKFSMIVCAAEVMITCHAQVEFAQIPVKYYKDTHIDLHLWNKIDINDICSHSNTK